MFELFMNRRRNGTQFGRMPVATAVITGFLAATASAGENDWTLKGSKSGEIVKSGVGYTLITHDSPLVYGQRDYGINLKWGKVGTSPRNIHFVAPEGADIKFGQKVAIKVDGGSFLKYEKRRWGINLVWSDTPGYEWEIQGGAAGKPVTTGVAVSLYNHVEKDHMVYCKRPSPVVNLAWADDCIGGVRPPQNGDAPQLPAVPGLPSVPKLP